MTIIGNTKVVGNSNSKLSKNSLKSLYDVIPTVSKRNGSVGYISVFSGVDLCSPSHNRKNQPEISEGSNLTP